MSGAATNAQIAAFLTALRMKGEVVEELIGFARAMRQPRWTRRSPGPGEVLDTCGTGGEAWDVQHLHGGRFVVAAAGVRWPSTATARRPSSLCGWPTWWRRSASTLDLEPDAGRRGAWTRSASASSTRRSCTRDEARRAGAARLGIRTVFNLLGPSDQSRRRERPGDRRGLAALTEPLASVLAPGSGRCAPSSSTAATASTSCPPRAETRDRHERRQAQRSLDRAGDGRGAGREGRRPPGRPGRGEHRDHEGHPLGQEGPKRDIVVMNAAVALVAAGQAKNPKDGAEKAAGGDRLRRGTEEAPISSWRRRSNGPRHWTEVLLPLRRADHEGDPARRRQAASHVYGLQVRPLPRPESRLRHDRGGRRPVRADPARHRPSKGLLVLPLRLHGDRRGLRKAALRETRRRRAWMSRWRAICGTYSYPDSFHGGSIVVVVYRAKILGGTLQANDGLRRREDDHPRPTSPGTNWPSSRASRQSRIGLAE